MKKVALILTIGILVLGCAKTMLKDATVVRDCTGTYVRIQKTDYYVCNKEMIEAYPDGSHIRVKYAEVDECAADTGIVCMMYHENAGNIELKEVEN